jgi:phosphoglycerate dehydrogenase-like enzyme
MNDANRYTGQQQIIPAERMASMKAVVIGVGAIGRQVALNWRLGAERSPGIFAYHRFQR